LYWKTKKPTKVIFVSLTPSSSISNHAFKTPFFPYSLLWQWFLLSYCIIYTYVHFMYFDHWSLLIGLIVYPFLSLIFKVLTWFLEEWKDSEIFLLVTIWEERTFYVPSQKNPFHLCVSYGVRSLVYLYRSSFYAMF